MDTDMESLPMTNFVPALDLDISSDTSESLPSIRSSPARTKSVETRQSRLPFLRQNPVRAKPRDYNSLNSSQSSSSVGSQDLEISSSESVSSVVSTTKRAPKFTRPKILDGDTVVTWTAEKFDKMEKLMKFHSRPNFSCAKCKDEIVEDSQLAWCHDFPFHKSCAKEVGPEENVEEDCKSSTYKCDDCAQLVCFICKMKRNKSTTTEDLGVLYKCSAPKCGLLFHRDCLVFNWPQADVIGSSGQITCPLHFCHGCKAEHFHSDQVRDYRLPSSKAIRCLYCLSAYHKASCIPAGSGNTIMKNQFLICPRHSSGPVRKNKRLGCFICQKKLKTKDTVVNCRRCPFSFHANCVHGEFHVKAGITLQTLQNSFQCEGCLWGNFPRYGQVVWFQQPGSIYWPSMILYPRDCAGRGANAEGQFSIGYCGYPVQFYDNGRIGDMLTFEIGTKEFLKKLNLYSNEKVSDAANEAFQLLKLSDAHRDKLLPKPEPIFRKLEKNLYRVEATKMVEKNRNNVKKNGPKRRTSGENDERCECGKAKNGEAEGGQTCTPDSGCFNRDAAVECNSTNCSGYERCQNRMFSQKKNLEYMLEYFVSPSTKGWGLKAKAPVKKGTYLCEYVGEVISKEEVTYRVERKADDDPMYFLEVDSAHYIDAEYYGNLSRLINHSCDPNCKVIKYVAQGKRVIGIFADKDIAADEELTFDYNYGPKSTFSFQCKCKTSKCKGVIGQRPGNEENLAPKGRKRALESDARWEDDCATCGMRGELLMCEFDGCCKAHHLQCVKLPSTPKGSWHCPLHGEETGGSIITKKSEKSKLGVKGQASKKKKVGAPIEA